jgi:hypothetical protein
VRVAGSLTSRELGAFMVTLWDASDSDAGRTLTLALALMIHAIGEKHELVEGGEITRVPLLSLLSFLNHAGAFQHPDN